VEDLAAIVAARHGPNQALGSTAIRAAAPIDPSALRQVTVQNESLPAHRQSLEYVEIHLDSRSGSIEVAASNRAHGGDKPHRRGTPSDDDWSDSAFVSVADPILGELTSISAVLSGLDVEALIGGRSKLVTRTAFAHKAVLKRPL
jgi:hypothetical protein